MELPNHLYDLDKKEKGIKELEWAKKDMPVLWHFVEKYKAQQPLDGIKVGGCVHLTKETGNLILAIRDLGAEVSWAGCNPLSTKDEIVSALLNRNNISVYGWYGQTEDEYWACIDEVCKHNVDITVDDGADLVAQLHKKFLQEVKVVLGGTEETTTGVNRLRAMADAGELNYPIIAVNDAWTKQGFDNYFGTGQSTLDGIIRATDLLISGKIVVVAGYGQCGKGVATRAKGLGAQVIITETSPIRALEAVMEGYQIMPMNRAARLGDVFITVTGNRDILTSYHFSVMKDGAYLANAGHFDLEIDMGYLEDDNSLLVIGKEQVREHVRKYDLYNGRSIYVMAEGRLVNLVAAKGHPSAVMDMSFSNQLLAVIEIAEQKESRAPGVYPVPLEQDNAIAAAKLKTMGIWIDQLKESQRKYLDSF